MTTHLRLSWSDIPTASSFSLRAFRKSTLKQQTYEYNTDDNFVFFYSDDDDEWEFYLYVNPFDGSKYRIKHRIGEMKHATPCKPVVGFSSDTRFLTVEEQRQAFVKGEPVYQPEKDTALNWLSQRGVLVVEFPGSIEDEVQKSFMDKIQDAFGKDQKIIITTDGIKIRLLPKV